MQKIINETKLDFDDVLIRPKRSTLKSRSEVDLTRTFKFTHSPRELQCVPIMVANMDTVGTMAMAKSLAKDKTITCLHKHYDNDSLINLYTDDHNLFNKELIFYSTGTSSKDIHKLEKVFDTVKIMGFDIPNVCLDVANGYTEQFVKTAAHIRKLFPEIIIMAGNVVTQEMVEELIIHGKVDIVKVGIGSGSVCTTRLKTGVGYPQLSAVMECADAAHGLGGHICSDGGCKVVGDICKAFGGNADFVMLGSMFAGADECEGEWKYEYKATISKTKELKVGDFTHRVPDNSEWWQPIDPGYKTEKRKVSLQYYGMSSKNAMDKHHDGVANYRTAEGKCVTVSYKGHAIDILQDIYGGLRSACTYVGANKIKDFGKKTTFIQVNNTHNKVYEK
jgi:GMP reductase